MCGRTCSRSPEAREKATVTTGKCAKQNKIARVSTRLIKSFTPTPYLKINLGAPGWLGLLNIDS